MASPRSRLPRVYRLFFLVIEPTSALVGAYFTHFRQGHYLRMLDDAAPDTAVPRATSVALSQLANMFLFFALNEALVLRATGDLRVWRTVLAVLLLADVGHLYSMRALGPAIYYNAGDWNASDYGNVPWVMLGATLRICFLLGVGFSATELRLR
jgi:hypothetical protein